jgi:hypothetical protein
MSFCDEAMSKQSAMFDADEILARLIARTLFIALTGH